MHAPILRYIDHVARFGSIRRAAQSLNVASSAVNRQILHLEQAMGVELFDRIGNGVRPTPAGEYVIRHARDTLAEWQRMRVNVSALGGNLHGEVKIGSIPAGLLTLLPRVVELVSKTHPNITFNVLDLTSPDNGQQMRSGTPDAAILFIDRRYRDYEIVAQLGARVGVIMHPDHPLAGKKSLSFTQCSGYPTAMLEDPWMLLESAVQAEFSRSGGQLNTVLRTNSISITKRAMLAGVAIGFFTPLGFIDEIRTGQLVHVPLTEVELAATDIGLFVHRGRGRSPAIAEVVRQLRIEFSQIAVELAEVVNANPG